jgi:phosphoribosylanthranilate isomerase
MLMKSCLINLLARKKAPLLVKVCGMRDAANIAAVARLQPDFMGFVFYPSSPRYAGEMPPAAVARLPPGLRKVGVFVNETSEQILAIQRRFGLEAVQLHGQEAPEQCAALRAAGLLVIKAFAVGLAIEHDSLRPYVGSCDYFLFDTQGAAPGGNGTAFRWSLLQAYNLPTPYFLAGGIALQHAATLAALRLPGLAGIDLNSRFEKAPGVKDETLVGQMLTQLRPRTAF